MNSIRSFRLTLSAGTLVCAAAASMAVFAPHVAAQNRCNHYLGKLCEKVETCWGGDINKCTTHYYYFVETMS